MRTHESVRADLVGAPFGRAVGASRELGNDFALGYLLFRVAQWGRDRLLGWRVTER